MHHAYTFAIELLQQLFVDVYHDYGSNRIWKHLFENNVYSHKTTRFFVLKLLFDRFYVFLWKRNIDRRFYTIILLLKIPRETSPFSTLGLSWPANPRNSRELLFLTHFILPEINSCGDDENPVMERKSRRRPRITRKITRFARNVSSWCRKTASWRKNWPFSRERGKESNTPSIQLSTRSTRITSRRTESQGMRIWLKWLISRAASQVTGNLLDVEEEEDKGEYNEIIIEECGRTMPNSYFDSDDFLEAFENQCNQISGYLEWVMIHRTYL